MGTNEPDKKSDGTTNATHAEITMPNGSTVTLKDDKPAPLVPSEYQKRLIKQWYEGGNAGPAPFANVNGQLVWVNRKARRTAAKINRKR